MKTIQTLIILNRLERESEEKIQRMADNLEAAEREKRRLIGEKEQLLIENDDMKRERVQCDNKINELEAKLEGKEEEIQEQLETMETEKAVAEKKMTSCKNLLDGIAEKGRDMMDLVSKRDEELCSKAQGIETQLQELTEKIQRYGFTVRERKEEDKKFKEAQEEVEIRITETNEEKEKLREKLENVNEKNKLLEENEAELKERINTLEEVNFKINIIKLKQILSACFSRRKLPLKVPLMRQLMK